MIVAVASQDFRTVSPHAGKTRRFILFEASAGRQPAEIDRIDLPEGMAFHDFRDAGAHPLDRAKVILAASAGEGFVLRMAGRGIIAAVTGESEPREAARRFVEGETSTRDEGAGCKCNCSRADRR